MKGQILTLIFAAGIIIAHGKNPSNPAAEPALSKNHAPLSFTENKGQVKDQNRHPRPDIQFSIKAARGLNIFIGNGAIHYQFSRSNGNPARSKPLQSSVHSPKNSKDNFRDSTTYTLYRMDVELVGANKTAKIITGEKQDYYENYFTDGISKKGATAYTYNSITYKDIYPNIDWVLYTKNGQLEHEFVVREGGKASDIKLEYGGAQDLKLSADGSLTAITPQGIITEKAPVSYQSDGKEVKSGFKLSGEVLTYVTDGYTGTLTIDPNVKWATYFGGEDEDGGYGLATDHSGNVYMAGATGSFPGIATTGAYQTTLGAGGFNAFLAKFDGSEEIKWATYFGGGTFAYDLSIDSHGNLYIAGSTGNDTSLATAGAYQTICGGGLDAFLAKFDTTGALLWSTFFGGASDDRANGVATDGYGNVYIAGYATSTSAIATPGAYDTIYNGGTYDAFLAKFDSAGSIQWATYFGGGTEVVAEGVATDLAGNVFITGLTTSTTGIATPGAYQTTYSGGFDAFLAKFNTTGALQWSTYYGGGAYDYGYGLATDDTGNVYITGETGSNSGFGDAYLAKFNGSGGEIWSDYFGGSAADGASGIALDGAGHIYLAGWTKSSSGLATPDAYQTTYSPGGFYGEDAFLAKFDNSGTLQSATYYGGNDDDAGSKVAVDDSGDVYLTGNTKSLNDISTSGAYQLNNAGEDDAFLVKFDSCTLPVPGTITGLSACVNATSLLSSTTPGGIWSNFNPSFATVSPSGHVTGLAAGVAGIEYVVTNACGSKNTTATLNVYPVPTASVIPDGLIQTCVGDQVPLVANQGASYAWSIGDTSQSITVTQTGTYTVTVTSEYCGSAVSAPVTVTFAPFPFPNIFQNGMVLSTTTSGAYQWYVDDALIPGATQSTYTATQDGTYWVEVTVNGCPGESDDVIITTTGISAAGQLKITIGPNPVKDVLKIDGVMPYRINIINAQGQLVKTSYQTNYVSIADQADGIYLVQLVDLNGASIATKKMVKQN